MTATFTSTQTDESDTTEDTTKKTEDVTKTSDEKETTVTDKKDTTPTYTNKIMWDAVDANSISINRITGEFTALKAGKYQVM